MFDHFVDIDPRSLGFKFVQNTNVPYVYKYCNTKRKVLSSKEAFKFKNLFYSLKNRKFGNNINNALMGQFGGF